MAQPEVFLLSDVAAILNLPESTVKNWTIGRPLKIEPSIRSNRGPGSRNLYCIEDVYLMAVADQICRDGFTTQIAERALEAVRPKVDSLGGKASLTLVIASAGGDRGPEIRLVRREDGGLLQKAGGVGCYALNLDELVKRVRLSIDELPARLAARKKAKAKKGRQ